MKVRAKEMGYYKGRRRQGAVFEFAGDRCPKWCELADKPAPQTTEDAPDYDAMTKKEVVAALAESGAGFDSTARRDLLVEQLKAAKEAKR